MGEKILIMAVRKFVTDRYRHLGKYESALGKMGDLIRFDTIAK